MTTDHPSAAIVTFEQRGVIYYEAKFRHQGTQIKRRIGKAWLVRDPGTGELVKRDGRVRPHFYDRDKAAVEADRIVKRFMAGEDERERTERERRSRGLTFRELAAEYLRWLQDVRGAKPSTLRDHRIVLGEPGVPYLRGRQAGQTAGRVMAALGDRPVAKITTEEIEEVLTTISRARVTLRQQGTKPRTVSARTVNKHRAVISAVFGYGAKKHRLANPAHSADRRREPEPGALTYYTPEEVEAIARALEDGRHRSEIPPAVPDAEREAAEDHQDAELIRVAAYTGLRQGELLALKWGDVEFGAEAITVSRALSAGIPSSPKSGKIRRVPLSDQASAALDRLSRRDHFTDADDLVFANALGRPLDDSALRRRYRRAQKAASVRELRFHDLRHSFGSHLAAAGVDVVTIKSAMGHSALRTTERYLHARAPSEQAALFSRAFAPAADELEETLA